MTPDLPSQRNHLGPLLRMLLFSHRVMSDSLRSHGLQHARLPLSFTVSRSLLRLMSIESVRPSNHLSHPLLPPSPPASNLSQHQVSSSELALCIRWPEYWSFSISPSNEYLGLTGLISLQSKGLSRVFSITTVQKHQFFGAQPSLWSNSHIHTWLLEKP